MAIRHYLPAAMMVVIMEAVGINLGAWIEVHGGSWKPDAAMLAKAENVLRPAVTTAASGRGKMPPWSQYHFQYQGQTTLLGHKYIYINAFCDGTSGNVSKDWMTVLDGGACYFSAKFDPDKVQVCDVAVNGVA